MKIFRPCSTVVMHGALQHIRMRSSEAPEMAIKKLFQRNVRKI